MEERRQRGRYTYPESWIRWEPWSFWRLLTGGRIRGDSDELEEVDLVDDISAVGVAFVTSQPPEEGLRILVNVFAADDSDPVIARGVVSTVSEMKDAGTYRVAVEFEKDLPKASAARLRMFGDSSQVRAPLAAEAVPDGDEGDGEAVEEVMPQPD